MFGGMCIISVMCFMCYIVICVCVSSFMYNIKG